MVDYFGWLSWSWAGWDAVAALGQAIGAIGTGAAFLVTARMLKVERNRDQAQRNHETQAQAARIVAWPTAIGSDPTSMESTPNWGVALRNGSDLPIYQVSVELRQVGGFNMGEVIFEVIPPGDWVMDGADLYPRSAVPVLPARLRDLPQRTFTPSIRFTDASGTRWLRTERGDLQMVSATQTSPDKS